MRTLAIAALLLTSSSAFAEDLVAYPNGELLVEPETLDAYLDGDQSLFPSGITLIDVRSAEEHSAGNLMPGYRIDIGEWKKAFGDGTDAADWTTRIGAVVHEPEKTVIVYDSAVTSNAARTWWLLKYWGIDDVRILNGGFKAAKEAGLKSYATNARLSIPSKFVAKPHPERLATHDEVLMAVAGDEASATCLIDTRSAREVAAGTVPTAKHSEWKNYVDPTTGKMRIAAELKSLLDKAGFDPEEPAMSYCRSGGRASVVAFAMELMGGEQVANYYGSWNDWSSNPASPVGAP